MLEYFILQFYTKIHALSW